MPNLILVDAHSETERIRVMTFADPSGAPLSPYTPGAHIDFLLGENGERSYSLIDWQPPGNAPARYTVAVQCEEDGEGGSKAMHALQPGDHVSVTRPANDFEMQAGTGPVLLLAGGIGVTPLISMATELSRQGRPFQFHYTARSQPLTGFHDRLAQAFASHMTFHFDDQNPVSLDQVMRAQQSGTHIYICGPAGMIEAAKTAAANAGHCDKMIHVELFAAPQTRAGDQAFEVEIKDTGEVFTIPAGKTIIEVLEEAGKDLMYDCQRGDCGICRTQIISGTPDHRDVVLSEDERDSGKVMQICVSRSKSPRLILDL